MQLLLSFLSGALFFSLFSYFPFSIIVLFVFVAAFLTWKRKILLVLFIVIGIFYAFLRYSPAEDMPYPWGKELRVTGGFTQGNAPVPGKNIQTFVVDTAWDDETGEEEEVLRDKEIGLSADFAVDYDDRYELLLETGKDRTRLNPGQLWKSRLFAKVITVEDAAEAPVSLFSVFDRQRGSLNRYISGRFNEDSAALISALTTGETSNLSDETRDAFNAAGLAHILSISGTHFGLFSVMLFGLFGFLIKRLPYQYLQRLTIYLSPSQAAALLSIPFMIMYLGISGGSIPAVRSFIMINLFLFGLLIGRSGFWLNSLLCAAVVLVVWDPEVISNLSFQLSFIAVLFIGFSLEKKEAVEEVSEPEGKRGRIVRYIKNAVMLSVAASLGTAPLAAYYFHYVSLISPLSNLVVVPIIGFVLVPLSLISSFAYIFSGHYIFAMPVSVSSDLSIALVKFFASLPFAALRMPAFPPALCIFFYGGFLLYLVAGRNKKLLALSLLPFCVYAVLAASEKKELSVTFVDVGQGDSAVIELPDRKTIVIDTGRTGKETAAFLRYLGKRDIDALVLTHCHPDHTGGMEYIMKRFNVKEIWDNGRILYPPELDITASHRTLERGDTIEAAGCRIETLHPYREFYTLSEDSYSEENSSSLVLKVTGKARSFLFAGDIEEEAEEDIAHLNKWLQSDVLKVPHHGSRTSAQDNFLDGVSPSIAVISVGRDNSFGHPSQETLEKLAGIKIFQTDQDGAVKIVENGDDLLVKTCREFMFQKADNFETEAGNIRKLFAVW
ncbi:MAG: DNA internalization-related competence protein ComEC/Rec2 [Nitrospira bacterium HGW-Nitrospira-1]|nr:MAG: DNA internalization-related competence protein ComEC/Rec2 [Nitrospira bacterium HGW-Nitrospira-1]